MLGPGDELFLYVIGAPPNSSIPAIIRLVIDREGKIYIPNFGVFYLWGLTLKEAQDLLSKALGVNLKLTLGKLRNYPVYVSGEVENPGAFLVTEINTVLDVLSMAKGIKKEGSLRRIIITERNGKKFQTKKVDLYQLLVKGIPVETHLKPGSVVFVPPIGKTVAIAGKVKRPAIYEITGKETIKDIIDFAGGLLPSAYKYKVLLKRFVNNQKETVLEGSLSDDNFLNTPVKDGDLIIIKEIRELPENAIFVEGPISQPGSYAWKKGLKLSDILTPNLLLPETNIYYAEIERYDPRTLKLKKIIVFKPLEVIEGKYDIDLKPLDKIIFYPKYVFKPIKITGEILNPVKIPYQENMTLSEALSEVKFKYDVTQLKAVVINNETKKIVYLNQLLKENDKTVDINLQPGTEIIIQKIQPVETVQKVIVSGYVWRPGVYKITDRTTLYEILKRAGGFRPGAYPQGIVILRKSIARMQQERLKKAIILMKQTLEKEEAGIMQADLTGQQAQAYKYAFEAKRRLLQEMEKTMITGRLVGLNIPPNLEALKYSPSNIILEDGDRIYVPKVPSAVLVFGEVLNPSAILYKKGLTVKDYIQLAGGFTKYADIENIFVIKANGVAISSQTDKSLIEWDENSKRFVWGMAYNEILDYKPKPGDAIIVPTKVKVPVFWRPLIKDVIQIIYQSALTVYTISKL